MSKGLLFFDCIPRDNTPIPPRVKKKKSPEKTKKHRTKTTIQKAQSRRDRGKEKRRQVVVKEMDYYSYITSSFWYKRRADYFQVYDKRCAICDTTQRITLHHKHYGTLRNERDKDLVSLCWKCHERYHNTHKVATIKTTDAFIITERLRLKQNM